jgi:hypothetical protein
MAAGKTMTQAHPFSLSRRAVCLGGVAGLVPVSVWGSELLSPLGHVEPITIPPSHALQLRGVQPGGHAILRTQGSVNVETPSAKSAWRFEENTTVSWAMPDAGRIVERRRGRLQLSPHAGGKTIEISTGPVEEHLFIDGAADTVARSSAGQSLIVAARTLTPSDVWQIADDPVSAVLPAGLSEFRVFRAAGQGATRHVTWAMRSPWLSVLGEASPETRLIWRGQGRLTAWRAIEAPDFV